MSSNKLNVIFNGVFGSGLYGLSTPTSDEDFKGIYLPTKKQLVFNDYKDSIEKQTEEIDTTYYAVTKFIKILEKCDTVSMDMIHTPEQFTIETSTLWGKIQSLRGSIYCKNMRGILGYIRTQSSKYGHKVDRYNEMFSLMDMLYYLDDDGKVEDTTLPEMVRGSEFKYIKYTPSKGDVRANIDVCGSRYQINANVSYLREGLTAKINRYGKRTKKGSLQHGDWKSLSHAYRVLLQLEEIIDTRDLIFPLAYAPEIMKIKLGNLTQECVMSMINDKFEEVTSKLEGSDLPEYSDVSGIKDLLMEEVG